MKSDFTENQNIAITTDGCDICVAAGAGSGKTGVLVERFVRIVTQSRDGALAPEHKAGVGEILVITFTEKATKEMKSRIVAALSTANLVEERRQIETAYISTIHGFCSRLLQENPFEANVDPQFRVLDDKESKQLIRTSLEDVVAEAYASENDQIIELAAGTQHERVFGDTSGEPLQVLGGAVELVMSRMRGAGKTQRDVAAHAARGADAATAESLSPVWAILGPLLNEMEALFGALGSVYYALSGTLKLTYDMIAERAKYFDSGTSASSRTEVTDTLEALDEISKSLTRAKPRSTAGAEIEADQIFARMRILCTEVKVLFGAKADHEKNSGIVCHRLWVLTAAVWERYDALKRAAGVLDNDDLQAKAVELLGTSPGTLRRYQRRLRHLMIDEFQDTNPLQMQLVELLHSPGENFLFVVGDVQQSIYGFRNADPSLFRALERRYRDPIGRTAGGGRHVQLADNFRSRPEILKAVEHLFRHIWRDQETPFVPLQCGALFDPKSDPSLELLLTQELQRKDYVRLEADALAARIDRMVTEREILITSRGSSRRGQPVRYRDVAVLLRGLTDIQKYEEAFARRGVPYFVVGGGRGYYARPEIRDLVNVLTLLDSPLNDIALTAALRSPFVGADVDTLYRLSAEARKPVDHTPPEGTPSANRHADRQQPLYYALTALISSPDLPEIERSKLTNFVSLLDESRYYEDRLPVGHLLERLIDRSHYDARLLCRTGGRRRLANVRKLLHMANSDTVTGVRAFIQRLKSLERLSDREGEAPTEEEEADVVRFLTIHGAKGLEFPVVILADLSRNLIIPERGQFCCEPNSFALGTRLGGEQSLAYKAITKRRETADREEYARLLYVAITRAREHLILCGNLGNNRGFNWSDTLFPNLGILAAPPDPTEQILLGGLRARIAPLAYSLSEADSRPRNRSRTPNEGKLGDRIERAILAGGTARSALTPAAAGVTLE